MIMMNKQVYERKKVKKKRNRCTRADWFMGLFSFNKVYCSFSSKFQQQPLIIHPGERNNDHDGPTIFFFGQRPTIFFFWPTNVPPS